MKVDLIEKNAVFISDKEGILVITDIEKNKDIIMAELIYDGKNVAILNRNNKEFYSLKNIAPLIREKIKQSKFVTIIERDKDNIYPYQVEVHLKNNLGFEDDFEEYAKELLFEIKDQLSPENFEEFLSESQKFAQEFTQEIE